MARRRRRRGEPRRHRRRSLVEALEPRILLSADLPGLAVDAALPADADAPASEERVLPRHPDATGVEQHAGSRELVFVDAGVEGYQELLRDLREGAGSGRHIEVVLLDSAQDGIAQIGDALSAYDHDLDAVHVVSHGSEQGVLLGDTWLTAESLAARAGDVAAWRDALSADADLLLYGCNLAAGGEGQSLVEELSLLTGADVAASADLTGAAARGGDWDLEYATGSLETSVTFSGTFQQVWSGVLGNVTFQQGADGYASTSDTTLDSQEAGFSHGGWSEVEVDGNGVNQGLIRFDNLFGSGPGQIPVGSTIHSASLAVDVTNSASDTTTISLHRMLMPWNESATWFSTGNGVQANDVEALSTPDSVLSGAPETDENGWQTFTGLETTLQGWADGTANEGWVVLNDGANGWRFASSEDSEATRRPVLSVSFTPPGVHSVVDNFDASTYGANDGTDPWSSDWQEVGESGSPGSGGMRVVDEEGGSLRFGGAATRDGDYVWRQADLSGATSATLNFQYKWEDGKSGAVVLGVEVRASDQDPWTHLATMGPAPYVYQNFSQDISGFASSTTQVRLVIESREDDKLYVDNVQIEFTTPSGAGSAIWSEAGSDTPETNTFDGSGFGTETGTADVGNQWQVVAGAESPTRDEKIVIGVNDGGLSGTGDLTGQIWNGTSWTAFTFNDMATDIADERWGFDVAYESQSGRAMVVYTNGNPHELSYRIWDGTTWTGPDTIWIAAGFDQQQLRLAASPDSNEMVLVSSNGDHEDSARVWNGSSWGNAISLDDRGSISNTDVYVAYEQQSGHAMVVYGGNSEDVYYRTWNGSSWSGVGAIAAPSGATGVVRWTVLASDPNSDRLAIGVIGENKEAWLATWDGDAWEDGFLATTDSPHRDRLAVAVAFEGISGNALAAYATRAETVSYRTWVEGAGWSSEQAGPYLGFDDHLDSLTLDTDPQSDTVMMSLVSKHRDVVFAAWDGGAWSVVSQQESDAGTNKGQPFLFLWDATVAAIANSAPTATADIYTTAEDTPLTIAAPGVLANDGDANGDALSAVLVSGPANGTLGLNADGSFTYTPDAGFTGTDSFRYEAQDPSLASSGPVTATIDVTPPNLSEGLWLSTTGNVSSSGAPGLDSWQNGEVLEFGDPDLEFAPGLTDGTFSSVVNLEALTGVNFTLDGMHYVTHNMTLGTTHTIDLEPGDLLFSTAGSEDFGSVQVQDTDVLLFRPDSPGDYRSGTLSVVLRDLELLPDPDLNGMADLWSFTLVEQDTTLGDTRLMAGDFLFSQAGANDNDIYVFHTVDVGDGTTDGTAEVLIDGNDVGINQAISGLELLETATIVGDETLAAGELLLSLRDNDGGIGTSGITAAQQDVFRLQVAETTLVGGTAVADAALFLDGSSLNLDTSGEDLDALTVVPSLNDAPNAAADSYSTAEDTPLAVAGPGVLSNDGDVDGDTLSAVLDSGPSNGTLSLAADGSFTYTPDADFTGADSFTYHAEDPSGATSGIVTVDIDVTPVNDAPTAADDSYSTAEDTPLTVTGPGVLGNDGDVDGDTLSAVLDTGPSNGTLGLNADGSFTYTPDADFTGADSFTYHAEDPSGATSGIVTVDIDVTPVNDAPTAADDAYSTAEDTLLTVSGPGVLGNDGDVDGDTLSALLDSGPSNGTLSLATDGSFTYTPDADFTGTDSFTYHAEDPSGADSGIVTVDIDVTPVNDAPTAADDAYSTAEDTLLTVSGPGVLGNDGDVDGDALSARLDSGPSNGTLSLAADGSFTYTPDADFTGADSFTYHAEDPSGATSGIVTVDIDVTPVNDAPTAADDSYSTAEDTPLSVAGPGVLGNDGDVDGDTLSAVLDAGPSNGTLGLNADGSFTYTPDADFHGTDSFTYHAEDPSGASSGIVTVSIDVTPVNDAPTATADSYSTAEDTPLVVAGPGVLGNDGDVDGDALSAVLGTGPSNGTLALGADGSFTYTPDADFTGTDSFTYHAEDPSGAASGTVTVSIDVTPVNDSPTATADSYSTSEDTPLVVAGPGVLGNDGDVDGDTLSAVLGTGPSNGTLGLNADGSFTYTPGADFHGTDSFTYHAEDPSGASSGTVTVSIDVTPVNDAPTATADIYSTAEDTPLTVAGPGVLGNDGDVDGDALSAVLGTGPSNGTLALGADGSFTYTPDADFHGTDSFTYHAEDPSGASSGTVTVSIDVTPVNDAPTATADSYSTAEETPLTVAGPGVLGNDADVDGDTLSAVLGVGPSNGTLGLNTDGSFTYTPDADFTGADSFTYHAEDPSGAASGTVTVDIDVTPVNDAPTATADSYSTAEDTPLVVAGPGVLGNDGDVDGDALSAVLGTGPSDGTLALGADGSFTYTPDADFHGTDSFTYHAEDPSGASSGTVTVSIDVTPVNDAPTAADDFYSTAEDTPLTVAGPGVLGNDGDVDGDTLSAVLGVGPSNGTLGLNADGSFTYTPDADFTGADSFTYHAEDPSGAASGTVTVDIDVTPVNDAPTATADSYSTAEDTPLVVAGPGVLGNDGDVDGDALSAVLGTGPSNGTLGLNADGSFTYTPDADFTGTDSFTYHAEDPSGAVSGTVTVDIDVTPVNDAPTATADSYSTAEDTPLTVAGPGVLGNDGDVDGDTLSAVLGTGPSNGSLGLNADGSFTYTPGADFHGTDSFTYHAEDPSGASSGTVTVSIDVTPVNDAPTATADIYSTAEDTPLTVAGPGVLGNDGDVDGDALSAVLGTGPSNGTLALGADGSFTYTPDADFAGTDSFTYHAEDPSGAASGTVTVDIDVTPVNDAPMATADSYSTVEDTPLTVAGPGVLGNDGDVDGDTLSAVLGAGPSNGTLGLNADGSFTYTPDADFHGTDSFTYHAEDPSGAASGTVTVSIDVTPANDAPTATGESYSTAEDTPLTVAGPGVLGNDGDVDGDALSAVLGTGPSNGTLALGADGSFTYTPDADFTGTDSFTYHAEDPSGAASGTVTVSIDVTPVNDSPTATADSYSTSEDTPLVVAGPGVLGNDGDVDGDTLSAVLGTGPSNGTLGLNADGSFTYTPGADFHGTDSFTYHAEDPSGASSGTVTVSIDVTPVNDAPTATADIYSTAEDTPLTVAGPGVLGNDGDVDGDTLSAVLGVGPSNGTLGLNADGSFTYTPDADFTGADSFTYHAEDPSGAASGTVTVDIDVTPVNDAPTATADSYSTAEDTPLTVAGPGVLGNDGDVDGDTLSAVLGTGPSNGTLGLNADGSFTYTPDADFTGTDSFTYHAEDPSGAASGTVTVSIDVTPANDAPTATGESYSTAEDTPLTVAGPGVLGNDGDLDGDTLSAVLGTGPSNGALGLNSDGSFTYTPGADFDGTDSFTYHAEDPSGASSGTVTVSIDVTPVNDAPVLTPGSPSLSPITEDQTGNLGEQVSAIVGTSVSDADAGALEGIAVTKLSSGHGTWEFSIDGGGTWQAIGSVGNSHALLLSDADRIRFVPDAENADTASFDFRAWDRTSGVVATKVNGSATGGTHAFSAAGDRATIQVGAVNDAPGLADALLPEVQAGETDPAGKSVAGLFAGGFSDIDAGSALAGVAVVGNGASPAGEGAWSYSSDGGASWSPIGGVSDGSGALALSASTRVRFVPAGGFEGTPTSLSVRGLDDSYAGGFSTTDGGAEIRVQVDTSSHGGISAIAGGTSRLATSVAPAAPPSDPDPEPDPSLGEGPTEEPEPEVDDGLTPDVTETPGDEEESDPGGEGGGSPEPETPGPEAASAEPASPTPGPFFAGELDRSGAGGGSSFARPAIFGESLTEARPQLELSDPAEPDVAPLVEQQAQVWEPETEARALPELQDLLDGVLGFLDSEAGFLDELDQLRESVEGQALLQQAVVGTSTAVAAGLSIGYVVWLTRGGLLLASLVSSIPVWRLVDPIPVLASLGFDDQEPGDDGDSLDSLIRQGAARPAPEGERPGHEAPEVEGDSGARDLDPRGHAPD